MALNPLKKEIKRCRTVSLGLLGLAFTVGLFKLSSSITLPQEVKFYSSIATAGVLILSILTVAAAHAVNPSDYNLDMICSALGILTVYVTSALFLIMYSFSFRPSAKPSHRSTMIIVGLGAATDFMVFFVVDQHLEAAQDALQLYCHEKRSQIYVVCGQTPLEGSMCTMEFLFFNTLWAV